jgi:hypothetical protein
MLFFELKKILPKTKKAYSGRPAGSLLNVIYVFVDGVQVNDINSDELLHLEIVAPISVSKPTSFPHIIIRLKSKEAK